ncbi:aminoglycoside phosphotransferase family protein [Micromonospora sp. WMMD1102]|uniref:phosphotransferase family protein n=1 Tax=Micromonospora sp. WMMD1102 TaxID=3016105 RepID=UPI002414E082|nr:aminoglycoside phosphotransferase family protein [Micromonospora sp. WMMD1102]MDG4790977.1 aminoglycoside phosphotransferase family protein [Micromonospora sp. WMMD1102]
MEVGTLVPLGEGTDHVAYEVDGAYVVRQLKPVDGADVAAAIEREVALLDVVARVSPIPVPEVVAAAPEAGLMVQRKLPGVSLLDRPPTEPAVLVDQLAEFLTAVHGIPIEQVAGLVEEDRYPLAGYLAETDAALPEVAELLGADERRAVDRFLATAPPAEPDVLVFCHNDLGAEHLLAEPDRTRLTGVPDRTRLTGALDRTRLTGVLDWSDAAVADPAHDLGRIYRDLGPEVAARVAARLDPSTGDLLARAAFHARCALIEDLAFGVAADRRYVDAALAHLTRTFRD